MTVAYIIITPILCLSIAYGLYFLNKHNVVRNAIFGIVMFLAGIWGAAIFGVPMPIHRYTLAIIVFFGFLTAMELYTMFEMFSDWHQDRRNKSPRGYRYSNIPPDVNNIETWVLLAVGVSLKFSQFWLIVLILIQIIICLNGICRNVRNCYPHWFDWI